MRIPSAKLGSLLLAATLTLGAASARAQEPEGDVPVVESEDATEGTEGTAGETAAISRPSNAPFMAPMGRLANILGSMHFLRTLCGDENAGIWRDKMNEIVAAQKSNEADSRILIAQFNNGYRSFEATYRQCTPAAEVATRRYLAEGAELSREIAARYGN